MRQGILKQLNEHHAQNTPCVLIRDLDTHGDLLITPGPDMAEPTDRLYALAMRALSSDQCLREQVGDHSYFIQPFNPPLRLIIIGAVHIAQFLSANASACGYQVIVVDPRQAFANAARFPHVSIHTDWPDAALTDLRIDTRTAVVTLTHDSKLDDPALDVALRSRAFYIGALGGRKTRAARIRRLKEAGFTRESIARIHAPIGLDIGAQSPAEIAVSIIAQMTEKLRNAV